MARYPIPRRTFNRWAFLSLAAGLTASCAAGEQAPVVNPENMVFASKMAELVGVDPTMPVDRLTSIVFARTYLDPLTKQVGVKQDIGQFTTDKSRQRVRVQLTDAGQIFYPDFQKPFPLRNFSAPAEPSIVAFSESGVVDYKGLNTKPDGIKVLGIFYGTPGAIGRIAANESIIKKHLADIAARTKAELDVTHYSLMPSTRFHTFIDVGGTQPVNPEIQPAANRPTWDTQRGVVTRHDTVYMADMTLREGDAIGMSYAAIQIQNEANEQVNKWANQHDLTRKTGMTNKKGDEGPSSLLGLASMFSPDWQRVLLGENFKPFVDILAKEVTILEKAS